VDTVPGLKELQLRKRALLLESEMNRQVLQVECGRIRYGLGRLRRGYGWAQHAWAWAVPAAGLLLARKFKGRAGVFANSSLIWGALRSAWQLWERVQKHEQEPEP